MTQIDFKTVDEPSHRRPAPPAEALDGLRAGLRGPLCLPGEPGYEEARTTRGWRG